MKLGQSIVEIRKKNELTQEDFAKKFNVTRQTVSNWENERSYPDLLTLVKISDAYGYSLDRMLKEDPDMTKAMNLRMELGDKMKENSKKNLYFSLVGVLLGAGLGIQCIVEQKDMVTLIMGIFLIVIYGYSLVAGLVLRKKLSQPAEDIKVEDLEVVELLIKRGMQVEAIKMVRKITGLGLAEAKAFVDELEKEQGEN